MIKRLYNYLSDNAIFADFKSKSSSDYKSMHKTKNVTVTSYHIMVHRMAIQSVQWGSLSTTG